MDDSYRQAVDGPLPWSSISVKVGLRGFRFPTRGQRAGWALVPALRPSYWDAEGLLTERGIEVGHRRVGFMFFTTSSPVVM